MYKHKCKNCNKEFENPKKDRTFCCRKCYYDFYKGNTKKKWGSIEKICLSCGEKFMTRKSKNYKYCSHDCYNKYKKYKVKCVECNSLFFTKAKNSKYCEKCRTKKCVVCGKNFIVSASEFKGTKYNKPKKYCSSDCYYKSRIGKEPLNKNYVKFTCTFCGKTIEMPYYLAKKAKYCSKKCLYDFLSSRTGENNPLWKGGHSEYSKRLSLAKGSYYRNRENALKRDNNTCQKCGYKGEDRYMDIHHIIPIMDGGTNELDNLICLCRKCHPRVEKGIYDCPPVKNTLQAIHI